MKMDIKILKAEVEVIEEKEIVTDDEYSSE